MNKDSPTVRIQGMQTLAYLRGKLALMTFDQRTRTRSGEWRERTREIYDTAAASGGSGRVKSTTMAIRPPFFPTIPSAGPFC